MLRRLTNNQPKPEKEEEKLPLWRFHTKNDNERGKVPDLRLRYDGELVQYERTIYGPMWRAGRCWLHLYPRRSYHKEITLRAEWHLGPHRHNSWGAYIHHDGDDGEWTAHLGLGPVFNVYAGIEHRAFRVWKRKPRYGTRELGFSFHDGSLWWCLWMNIHEWHHKDAKWRRGHFDPLDFFFGRDKHSSRDLETVEAEITLPEGAYPLRITFNEHTWTRKRWPTRTHIWRQSRGCNIEVLPQGGIPIPGKGENSWDLDDDAIFEMSCPATTVEEAVTRLRASVERDRQRHGGPGWLPEKKEAI